MLSIVSPTFMVSCGNHGAGDPSTIPFVRDILSDTTSTVYEKIRKSCIDGRDGSIAIVGPSEHTLFLADNFMTCDDFDNVNGRCIPDGLPDFAGETFDLICDSANAPYEGYLEQGNDVFLKELTVKNFLSSIDTVFHASQFDKNTTERKSASKIVILSSSYLSAFGYHDIMSIVNAARPDIAVISPVHSMFRYAIQHHPEANGSFAVWTDEQTLGSGIYATAWSEMVKEYKTFKYEAYCPQHGKSLRDRIISFFRMYKSIGNTHKIGAVLVDDMPLKADVLNAELARMRENNDDSLTFYRGLLTDRFEFIDPATAIASECISFMRKENCFTHRVAYPSTRIYCTVPVTGMAAQDYSPQGGFTEDFKYNRADCSDFETFMLVEKPTRFLDENLKQFLRKNAQNIYNEYVSD